MGAWFNGDRGDVVLPAEALPLSQPVHNLDKEGCTVAAAEVPTCAGCTERSQGARHGAELPQGPFPDPHRVPQSTLVVEASPKQQQMTDHHEGRPEGASPDDRAFHSHCKAVQESHMRGFPPQCNQWFSMVAERMLAWKASGAHRDAGNKCVP